MIKSNVDCGLTIQEEHFKTIILPNNRLLPISLLYFMYVK